MMEKNVVYRHTCPDGRIYIGIAGSKPELRWRNGYGYKDSFFFWNGIVRFGWDNIKHDILYENLSKIDAINIEHDLIKKYSSWNPAIGFNELLGTGYGKRIAIKVIDLGMLFSCAESCAEYLNCPIYGVRAGGNHYGHTFEVASEKNCSVEDVCII